MPSNAAYTADDDDEKHKRQWARTIVPVKVHAYDDALDLAGNGWYSVSLLAVLSIANLSMAVEIFGISVILTGAHCEYTLDLNQTGILFAVTFIGPIVMAYPWGYLSDTQGRKKCLLISLWASFVFSIASAFSPNWITIGVLKLFSTSFVSCANSATYTLLGESCPKRMRDAYMLVMASVLDLCLSVYLGVAYVILNLDFSYDIGLITFTPWRLLAIVLALPIGIAAFGLRFFYESPRFLHNIGKEEEALDALREICRRNGGAVINYPVKQIFLNEEGNQRLEGISVLRSLWEQIVPLFKPPLLWRSLQLYFITFVVYGTNNSYFMWFPVLAEHFVKGLSSDYNESPGLCNVIVNTYKNSTETTDTLECTSKIDIGSFYSSFIQGLTFVIVLLCITRIAHRKRLLVITILSISGFCAIMAVAVKENITSLVMMFGFLINELIIGVLFSYFVDLYPTSYRGTAACLGTMVARIGALSGVYLLGAFIMSHCDITFYFCAVLTFCAVLVGLLLPPDSQRKK